MRQQTATEQTALQQRPVSLLIFVEMLFSSGPVRVCNSLAAVQWNGFTWSGLGNLASIEGVSEGAEFTAKGLRFTVSNVPAQAMALALQENPRGRTCTVWVAVMGPNNVMQQPRLIYRGRMSTLTVADQEAAIQVAVEDQSARLRIAQERRYNDADQQAAYPGDKGLEYIESLATDQEIKWGIA